MYNSDNLNYFKKAAFASGKNLIPFSIFAKQVCLHKTDLQSRKIAEIIIAWMLGYYIGITKDNLYVGISNYLDYQKGADFMLKRFRMKRYIQIKFNISIEHDRRQYDKNIIVFRCGPDKSFKNNFYVKTMTGDTVLINLLEQSNLYNIEEIYEAFDEVKKLKDLIRTAWRYIKN